jgi:hypothetical protein
MTACLIPPTYEEPVDSGANHSPSILRTATLPPLGEQLSLYQGQSKSFFVWVDDPDDQELTFRMFLQRKWDKLVPLSKDRIEKSTSSRKALSFEVTGLCDVLVNNVLADYDLEIYVSDGGFVESGKDLRETPVGALRNNDGWTLSCLAPTGPDGGS